MNNDTLKGTAKKIEGSVESLYGEATGDSSAQAKGEANKAKGKVLNAFGKIEDKVNDFVSYAGDEAESLKKQIHDKPVQSSLIALGVGFLLAKLIG